MKSILLFIGFYSVILLSQAQYKNNYIEIKTVGSACINNVIQFYSISDMPLAQNYLWNFGDGTTSTLQNPTHTYTMPGTYLVRLEVSNACGTDCTTHIIEIAQHCCAFDTTIVSYNDNDPEFLSGEISDPSGQIIWDTTLRFNKTLTIKAGNTLIIEEYTVIEFGPLGKLIVEQGDYNNTEAARLIMKPLSKLTSIFNSTGDTCMVMWKGVEVRGNANLTHSQAHLPYQGKIVMEDRTYIEHAHIGVLLGKQNFCFPNYCTYYAVPSQCLRRLPIPFDINYAGGVIHANRARFNNNAIGVFFTPFKSINNSLIIDSNFKGGGLMDIGYDHSYSYSDYNYTSGNLATSHNPLYANANSNARSVKGIKLWGVRFAPAYIYGIPHFPFYGNHFYNMEIGIESNTSRWNTKDSWFDNLTNGIRIFNFNSPVQGHTISNNTFNQIANEYLRLDGSRLDKISDNTFGEVDYNIGQGLKRGIVLNNSSYFDISDNDFNQLNIGIIAWNTGVGGGNIRAQNRIGENGLNTGNIFNRCFYDNITLFNNSRLRIKCNTSLNPEIIQGEYSDQNWMNLSIFQPFFPPSILAHQGHEDPNDSRKPAGNKFNPVDLVYPYTNDRRHITNHGWPYIYNAHSAPDERIPVALTPASIFVNTYSHPYEEGYSCVPCVFPYCDISAIQYKLADISESISSLNEEYLSVMEALDNGITSELLADISNPGISDEELGVLLINNSPLSNPVIISFIEREPFVDESVFMDVIVANSPISDSIWYYYMMDIIPNLEPENSDFLISAQGGENTIRTPALINREIEILNISRQVTFNDLIFEMLNNSEDFEEIISVLAEEDNNDALKLIVGTHFLENNINDALLYLNEFEPLHSSDSAWKELMSLIISFEASDSTLYDITVAQEEFIRDLAYGDEVNLPAVMAQAILRQLFGEEFDIQLPQPPAPRLSFNNDTNNTHKEGFNWNLYPNPAKDIVEITYQIPSEAIALLEVYTIFGAKTYQVLLFGNKSQLILNTAKFNSGIYLVRLTVNDNFTESKKMIILK